MSQRPLVVAAIFPFSTIGSSDNGLGLPHSKPSYKVSRADLQRHPDSGFPDR